MPSSKGLLDCIILLFFKGYLLLELPYQNLLLFYTLFFVEMGKAMFFAGLPCNHTTQADSIFANCSGKGSLVRHLTLAYFYDFVKCIVPRRSFSHLPQKLYMRAVIKQKGDNYYR